MTAASAPSSADAAILAILEFHPDGGAVLGHRVVPPASAQLQVLDLAATRGDGIFETISIGGGRLQALRPHLRRFAHSAAMLDLPTPDLEGWRDVVVDVTALLNATAGEVAGTPVDEGFVKIVLTRGVEGGDVPTGWAYATVSPDFSPVRADGVSVVLLDRGYRHDVAQTAPWLLTGAKTLSYAVNRAAYREAWRRGADDAMFVSSDGYLLESPTANLLLRIGRRLVTPRTDLGILTGTTQVDLFDWAAGEGYETAYELLTPGDLAAADAAWLVSSVRHAAPIRSIDGEEKTVDRELTVALNDFLRSRTE